MGSMIFYDKPVALNRERHLNLKLQGKLGDLSFAKKTNSVLLAATELAEAAKDYPVVFVGQENGPFTLAAMVGLRDGENLFIADNGQWQADTYVPAFVRRYPFILAENGEDGTQLTVCVDESYAGLSAAEGEALFDDKGQESPLLQGTVNFLTRFHAEMQRTRLFAQQLFDYGLLEPKVIEIKREGKKLVLDGLYTVSREKLDSLDDTKTLFLCRSGAMGWIHAHLLSLSHIERMARQLDQRQNVPPVQVAAADPTAAAATH